MKRYLCASLMLVTVLATSALAQRPDRPREGDRPRDGERRREGDRPREGELGPRDRGPAEGDRGPGPEGRGPGPEGRRGGPSPEAMMRLMPVLAALDADRDGKISKSEIENAANALKKLDKNNDGELTQEEIRPDFSAFGPRGGPPQGRGGPPPEGRGDARTRPGGEGDRAQFFTRMFEQRDENKDGKLSGDEIPEQMAGRLEQIDSDGDGSVSREELEAMARRMGQRGEGARRGRPEGEGGRPGGDRPRRPEAE